MKRILMLNSLPVVNFDVKNQEKKTAGNQTLYNTLKGYSDNGYAVTMITCFGVPKVSNPFPNITVRRSSFFMLFNIVMKLKQGFLNFFKKREHKTNNKITTEISRTGSLKFFKYWEVCGYIEGLLLSRKIKPDLIYGYEIYSTRPAKHLADKLGLPCVSRFQGTELGFFDNKEKFNEAVCYIKGTEVPTDLIIMANDGTDGDKVLQKLKLDENKVRFWVNGLHEKDKYIKYKKDAHFKKQMNLPDDAFIICTANRFVDWKRIDRIIKMMSELVKTNPNVYLIAIGDGPEKEAIMALSDSLKLTNVIFTGAMEHEDTIYQIANSDLYITLNHSGNLGNSILEALSLGIPVCTLKNDSVEKVLTNDQNAVLFNTVDEKMIANELTILIKDENKQRYLKKNAKKYAENYLLSWPERMELEIQDINKLVN
ncbi:UNVERIFIED_ORG: glycosyltransferase involved in cell wall biosynthesis [Bacillus sp. B2I3]|nr:glycosyltransferase involved in cell wall biosynthesis [Bacillus sp. B2I3]